MNETFPKRLKQIQEKLTFFYCALMFSFFLFYMRNGYFDITAAKRQCFMILSTVFLMTQLILIGIRWGLKDISLRQAVSGIHRFSLTDWAMLIMLCSHIITTWISPYPQQSLYGYAGRGMGLIYSFLIVFTYFFLSRQLRNRDKIMHWLLGCVTIVILSGLLNAMGVDPFHLFVSLRKEDLHHFLSTIGNITFFAHLIVMSLPIAVFLYDAAEDIGHRILYGGFIALAFCGIYVSHIDSAYLGLTALMLYYFFRSVSSTKALKNFLMILLLALSSVKLMYFAERMGIALYWDGISEMLVHSPWINPVLIADLVVLFLLHRQVFIRQKHLPYLRKGMGIAVFLCLIIAGTALIYFTWLRPDVSIGAWSAYLRLDDAWGSMRGFLWNTLIPLFFHDFTMIQQLFGQGLDCTRLILASADIKDVYVAPFDNAHNEYIQYLVTTGIVGLASYLCVLLSTIVKLTKHAKHNAYMRGIAGALVAHSAFALTGLNQPITTPLLFLLIGVGQSYLRNGE